VESTVVDCTGRVPVVLRPGAITLDDLRRVVPGTRASTARDVKRGRSPGMRHRHYAPEAALVISDQCPVISKAMRKAAFIGLHPPRGVTWKLKKRCADVEMYARELFHFFRQSDQAGVRIIVCEAVPEQGLGVALMDRIRRAAQGSSKFQVSSSKS
jgi:L-threonylcarbamoyladenylate synthase